MNGKNGPLDLIKNFFATNQNGKPPSKKNGSFFYVLIIVLLGTALMLTGDVLKLGKQNKSVAVTNHDNPSLEDIDVFSQKPSDQVNSMRDIEERYEQQLKEILEQMAGVQSVTVFVNVQSTERKVLEKNSILRNQTTSEEDREGGKRTIEDQSQEENLVILKEGNKDMPIVLETRKPEIKGVLVVAGGAENIQVNKRIREAVTRALDVPSHRVAVMPKKSKGDT